MMYSEFLTIKKGTRIVKKGTIQHYIVTEESDNQFHAVPLRLNSKELPIYINSCNYGFYSLA